MRSILLLATLLALAPPPLLAQSETNLDSLARRDGVYVHPRTLEPFTGPVVRMWETGTVAMRGTLEEGRWQGVRESFYLSGRLSARETFRAGLLHGPAEAYFKSGQLSARENYTNGRLDGAYESYWVRGAVAEQGRWSNGRPCGEWTSFGDTITYSACPRSGS